MVSNIKKIAFSVRTVLKNLFLVIKKGFNKWSQKLAIWRHFVMSGKHRVFPFLIIVLFSSQIQNYIITQLVSNFLMHLVRGWHFLWRKENTIRVFAKNLLRGSRRRNIFHISFLMTDLGYEPSALCLVSRHATY